MQISGAVVGAQVTAKSFPITENQGSNPVIVNFYRKFIYSLNKSAKMKRKRREILYDQHFFQNIRFLWPLGNKSGSTYQRSRCSRPYTFRHFLPSRILRVGDFIEADEDEVSDDEWCCWLGGLIRMNLPGEPCIKHYFNLSLKMKLVIKQGNALLPVF